MAVFQSADSLSWNPRYHESFEPSRSGHQPPSFFSTCAWILGYVPIPVALYSHENINISTLLTPFQAGSFLSNGNAKTYRILKPIYLKFVSF
ncbi:hypothetical protein LB505_003877 [Fusarium chuoi]|nr:hypothetical protein LB505_003877 [Fusarium chuoi]